MWALAPVQEVLGVTGEHWFHSVLATGTTLPGSILWHVGMGSIGAGTEKVWSLEMSQPRSCKCRELQNTPQPGAALRAQRTGQKVTRTHEMFS